jgi:hypothetical protein
VDDNRAEFEVRSCGVAVSSYNGPRDAALGDAIRAARRLEDGEVVELYPDYGARRWATGDDKEDCHPCHDAERLRAAVKAWAETARVCDEWDFAVAREDQDAEWDRAVRRADGASSDLDALARELGLLTPWPPSSPSPSRSASLSSPPCCCRRLGAPHDNAAPHMPQLWEQPPSVGESTHRPHDMPPDLVPALGGDQGGTDRHGSSPLVV